MIPDDQVIFIEAPRLDLAERTYMPQIWDGLKVTARHWFDALFKASRTTQYPEEQTAQRVENYRGVHRLNRDPDGRVACVACFMCETACPAECIHIVAEEDPEATVEWEKLPAVYEIDLLRCVFCGYCVDACPKEAIIMSREHEMAFVNRDEAVVGIDDLRQKGPIEEEDIGYRPYF